MRVLRSSLALLLLVTTVVWAPPAAVAADPPSGPMSIRSYGFEGGYPSWFTAGVNPQPPAYTPVAWWGRTSASKSGGSYGLWCAASSAANWPQYVSKTSGRATLDLPELADYYSSEIELYYTLPSRGAADTGSFLIAWYPTAVGTSVAHSYSTFPLSSSWTRIQRTLSDNWNNAFGDPVNLSRTAGTFLIEFNDKIEGGGQSPTVGQGVTIDDISVTGYMYGPVRDLAASATGTDVTLTWKKPYAASNSTSVEDRTLEYHVYRRLQSQPTGPWTELSTQADTGTNITYTDSTAVSGETYVYRVVANTPSSTTEYGETAETSTHIDAVDIDVTSAPTYTVVTKGTQVSYTYDITNTGSVAITGLTASDTLAGSLTLSQTTLDPDETVSVVSGPHTLNSDTSNTVSVSGNAGSTVSDSESSLVTVYDPDVALEVTPSEVLVNDGGDAVFDLKVTNTGDSALHTIKLKAGGSAVGEAADLAAGESFTLRHLEAASSDKMISFTVDAEYGSPSTPAFDGAVSDSGSGDIAILPSRISGDDRISTGIELSQEMFPDPLPSDGERAVVIATGYGYADALAAASLAGAVDGPLLLVRQSSVPSAVSDEITRLDAQKAYIVGGTGVVTDDVRDHLEDTLGLTVERLAGANRYGTAAEVARETKEVAGAPSRVFLATGADFPDALAASSLAAEMAEPIVLTRTSALAPEADALLKELKPSTIIVCGGSGAVSAGVATQLTGSAYGSPSVIRKGGANRYETAAMLAEYGESELSPSGIDGLFLATGKNYPDALAGGVAAAAGEGWRPLMLTSPTYLVPQAVQLIEDRDTISFISIVGGEGAVSDTVRTDALNLIQ